MTGDNWWLALIGLAMGYLSGSVPFGLILTQMAGLGDVRAIGSGNIGATNVLRTGHKGLAALTLLLDAAKGAVPVLIALAFHRQGVWGLSVPLATAAGALLGHVFPVWLGFRGGKGVATYIGVLAAFSLAAVGVFALAWLTVALVTRYSSLAALVAVLAVPLALTWLAPAPVAWLFAALTALVLVKHRSNVERLLAGTESRIGRRG